MIATLLDPASYHFNWLALPAAFTAILLVGLGLVVLVRERHSRVSLSFAVMTAAAAIWLFGYALIYCAKTERVAAAWTLVGQTGVTFIPPAVYHFTVVSLQIYRQHRARVWPMWCISGLFLLTQLWGEAFLDGFHRYSWGLYPRYNWMGLIFIGFFFVQMSLSLRHYWVSYHAATTEIGRSRNRGLFVAFCIAYFGSVDFLAAFGVPIYPLGCVAVFGFVVLVDRTIRRYHLLNITPAFAAKEIINAMDDALLVLDDEGIVRVVNRRAGRLLAAAATELDGASVTDVARAFASGDDQLGQRILDGSLRDYECLTRDSKVVVNFSSFVIHDQSKRPMATVCMIRDITQQKAAQQQIRRHTERRAALHELNLAATSTLELRSVLNVLLERLADLVPETAATILLLDEDKRLRKVACLGVDEQLWKAASGNDDSAHPAMQKREVFTVADMEIDGDHVEARFFLERGYRSYLGFPLLAKEEVVGILSFYGREKGRHDDDEIDFLSALAGQAAVAIYNSQLYEQTTRQALALEKANRVKEDFLSVMSHELRTPLNVIFGYTRLLQEGVMGSVNAEQNRSLEKIAHHANELLFMVSSIMSATKIEAGALTVDPEEFPLTNLLDELQSLYDYPIGKEIALSWDYPKDLPSMYSDRDKIKHILQNLINNALKFTDHGEVTVQACTCAGNSRIEFIVADTGVGIAEEDLPLIFDRFRQVDSSRTRGFGGVGLGLHIVKTFTRLLGGTVTVASTLGGGSTFTVTLPLVVEGRT